MAMTRTQSLVAATSVLALLTACADDSTLFQGEAGAFETTGTMDQIIAYQTGERNWVVDLAQRFNEDVIDTVNFEFNSATLDAAARATLDQQANFIRQFPELRFRVYGHTDLVGSNAYNKRLGMRRAQAVVAYLASRGVSRSRLEAVVSYGETQPIVNTPDRERRNRRTVTEVSGFVEDAPLIMDGKYAQVLYREYVESGTEEPRYSVTGIETLTTPESP